MISLQDTLDGINLRVLQIASDGEAVTSGCMAHATVLTSKAKDWEHFILVVRLDDMANLVDGVVILVLRAHKMKVRRPIIRCSVVDGGSHADFPS